LADLIAELQQCSPEFRAWWPEHEIVLDCSSCYEINHLLFGRLTLHPTVFPILEQPGLQMVVYTPLDTDTAAQLQMLSREQQS
jgi:transcription regulator MmyB-like protein